MNTDVMKPISTKADQEHAAPPVLAIVVPCYNEEEVIYETAKRLSELLTLLISERLVSPISFVLFVDDGSKDHTWDLIEELHRGNKMLSGLKLARNAGHQNALLSGLMHVKDKADCVVSIDADLQDDESVIKKFVLKYLEGYDIVYGVRDNRETDTWFKRSTAQAFYMFMQKLGVDMVYNHADFRLLSKRALHNLEKFDEVNMFLRGIVPMLGYKSAEVYYSRKERFAGESKYPLKKMIGFALNGITSFSISPIRMVTSIGFLMFLFALAAGLYALISKLSGNTMSGWASIFISVWFIGGVQLISIGLIGEYIGKMYSEVKRRPKYFIETSLEAHSSASDVAEAANPARRT